MKFYSPLALVALAATSMAIAQGIPVTANTHAQAAQHAKAIYQQKPATITAQPKMEGMTQKSLAYEKARTVAAHRRQQQSAKTSYKAKTGQHAGKVNASKYDVYTK